MADPYIFLFTDVEGSTRLWDESPDLAGDLIADQDRLTRVSVAHHGGRVFASGGDGVAVVFQDPAEAITAAIEAQLSFRQQAKSVAVRMGLHLGPVIERDNDYFGTTVNRTARIMAAAHGGQVLVSESLAKRVGSAFSLKDLGIHSLRDLATPERIFQVCHPDLAERFPPLRSLGSYRTNFPVGLPELIGREVDLESVADILATRRCVTVVGPGGVGKTRFVLQVGADLLDRYPGGVWIIELAALAPDSDVAGAMAHSIGLGGRDERSDFERVSEQIGQQVTLAVLDNCEHMLSPVADFVRRLLNNCRQLTVLATSRERLHLSEERVYDLGPLEIPEPQADPERIINIPAVQLLRQRAQEAGAPDPLESDRHATVSVCRRLDGLPLAIELAASRLRVMSITELDGSLAASLRLLANREASGPSHHATMTATIDWSYQMLNEEAQHAFERLGVFVGGFDLASAAAVGEVTSRDDFVELLTALVETSLVQHLAQAPVSRYRMLEPIRQHALFLLGNEESQDRRTRTRHAQYFFDLALEAEPHLFGIGQMEWLSRLDNDIDNLRGAQAWLAVNNPSRLLDFSAAMAGYWFHRAMFNEGKAALEAALAGAADSDPRRIDTLIGMAQIYFVGADYQRSAESAAEALEQAQVLGDEPRALIAAACLGRAWLMMGRVRDASQLLEQARSGAKRLAMARWEADASHFLGIVARQAGDHRLAQELHRAARAGFEEAGDVVSVGYAIGALAVDAWQLGQMALARQLSSESRRRAEKFGEVRGAAEGKSVLALFELEDGNLEGAYDLAVRSLRELRDIGARRGVAANLVLLARVKTAHGSSRIGAVLLGIAEAVFGRSVEQLPSFVSAGIASTLEQELGSEYQPALNEGRSVGWDGLDRWLEAHLVDEALTENAPLQ